MALASTIYDDFNGNTLDTTKWTVRIDTANAGSNYSVANGAVTVNSHADYNVEFKSKDLVEWDNATLTLGPLTGNWVIYTPSSQLEKNGNTITARTNMSGGSFGSVTYNASTMKYFRVRQGAGVSGTVDTWEYSANNYHWTYIGNPPHYQLGYTSAISITPLFSPKTFTLGAVNPPANTPPVSSLLTPDEGSTTSNLTPSFTFKAVDADADTVDYQIQISTVPTFATTHTDQTASTNATGFGGGTYPYSSNAMITYAIQTPITQGGISYYWRVRSRDPAGTNLWGNWTPTASFTSAPFPPGVASGTSANITDTTAVLTSEVTDDGGGPITERGVAYGTSINPTVANSYKTSVGQEGEYNVTLTGLTPNRVYNWRAYATNSYARTYGDNKTFTTLPAPTTIQAVHDITYNTAQVDVEVSVGGGATITERGVVWSTSENPTISNNKLAVGSGTGTYTAEITNLTGLTQYYVRPYAVNSQGLVYGAQTTFTTAQTPAAPTVATGAPSNIGEVTADIVGSEVILDGTQPVTERGIVFSDSNDDPSIADRKAVADSVGVGVYNATLTGLQPETLHYARAYATNSLGTGYGPVVQFTTLALFIPDEGDGYWTWQPDGSSVMIGRTQSTPAQASANLLLRDLGLEDDETYTLYYESVTPDHGTPRMVLQWYDNLVKQQQVIEPGEPYTFVYDDEKLSWSVRLFLTDDNAEPELINTLFSNMYLAKESEFSGFVPFVANGLTEIKLENNWLLDKRRETTISDIYTKIKGLGWREFTAKTTGLGWLEVGDMFTIIDNDTPKDVIAWETKITMDGGLKENISSPAPAESETDYNKASTIIKSLRRTQLSVDHNEQEIQALVEDIYSDNGVVNTRFSEVIQDIEGVRTTVQSSGGVNLVRNSVMYAFSDDGVPDYWTVDGTGSLTIQASPESLSGGGISGNVFTLNNETVSQTVPVRKDMDFVAQDDKLYYSFSARVRKNTVGTAYIMLTNRNDPPHIIELPDQTEFYWQPVSIAGLLPLDDYYVISIFSDADANLQVTDVMLSPGETTRQWTQSNGEAMNTNVAITDDGMTIRSNVFRNDYVRIDALGFEVHKHEAGGDRVFGFNGDETNVKKLRADTQISVAKTRMVPIDFNGFIGAAFTRTEDN